ncbi:MAG: hypothetical protein COZ09_14910, partial [Comamonadaceae bacterium CG_4_10_14_3_um_filter_60_42]
MSSTSTAISPESIVTPQSLHKEAAAQLEKAIKYHRQAALFHDAGDASQAENHASLAYKHTEQGLAASGR